MQSRRRSTFCASENRLPYRFRIVWKRASTSAWLSCESCGSLAGCWGRGSASERRVRALAGTREAAEAIAARRANSRREIARFSLPFIANLPAQFLTEGAKREATESECERQLFWR